MPGDDMTAVTCKCRKAWLLGNNNIRSVIDSSGQVPPNWSLMWWHQRWTRALAWHRQHCTTSQNVHGMLTILGTNNSSNKINKTQHVSMLYTFNDFYCNTWALGVLFLECMCMMMSLPMQIIPNHSFPFGLECYLCKQLNADGLNVCISPCVLQVFQKELGKRTGSVQALKRSARELIENSHDDSSWVKVQMQELSTRWETVCSLSVSKQTRLEQALCQVRHAICHQQSRCQMLHSWPFNNNFDR